MREQEAVEGSGSERMPKLQLHAVHGFDASTWQHSNVLEDGLVVFSSGMTAVTTDTDSKKTNAIDHHPEVSRIVGMALSPNGTFIACAEETSFGLPSQCSIYNLLSGKRSRVLEITNKIAESKKITGLAFSRHGKILVVQMGEPDFTIISFRWSMGKIIKYIRGEPYTFKILFNPFDSTDSVAVSASNESVRYWKIDEESLRPSFQAMLKRNTAGNRWQEIEWLNERSLAAAQAGQIIFFEDGEATGAIQVSEDATISFIRYSSRGFVCASTSGTIFVYEKVEDNAKVGDKIKLDLEAAAAYKLKNKIETITMGRLVHFGITQNEIGAVCFVDSPAAKDILVVNLKHATVNDLLSEEYGYDLPRAEEGGPDDSHVLTGYRMVGGMPQGEISSMDLCAGQALLSTVSADKTLRIWNYTEQELILEKTFVEELHSVAMHPDGFRVLVGADRLRMYQVLVNDLYLLHEFAVSNTKLCAFSHGGHKIATVYSSLIYVFDTYTYEPLITLKGHMSNVSDFVWDQSDYRILSTGAGGDVYQFPFASESVRFGTRDPSQEHVNKGTQYSTVTFCNNGLEVVAFALDGRLVHLKDGQVLTEMVVGECKIVCLTMAGSGDFLFAATDTGAVRIYEWPLERVSAEGMHKQAGYIEYKMHASAITSMRLNSSGTKLFTACTNGTIICHRVALLSHKSEEKGEIAFGNALALIPRNHLEERQRIIADLETKLKETRQESSMQNMFKEQAYTESKSRLENQIQKLEDQHRDVVKGFNDKIFDLQNQHREQLTSTEHKFTRKIADLEEMYVKKLFVEGSRYEEQKALRIDEKLKREEQLHLKQEEHALEMEDLRRDQEKRNHMNELTIQQVKESAEYEVRESEAMLIETEKDAEMGVELVQTSLRDEIFNQNSLISRLKAEIFVLQGALEKQMKITDEHEELEKTYKKEAQQEKEVIEKLKFTVNNLRKEIKEKDDLANMKDEVIMSLQQDNKELDKLKFILRYKFEQLKQQMEPREAKLRDSQTRLSDQSDALNNQFKEIEELKRTIGSKSDLVNIQSQEISKLRQQLTDKSRYLSRVLHDLTVAIEDSKTKKGVSSDTRVIAVYQKYCREKIDFSASDKEDEYAKTETARQRLYLEHRAELMEKRSIHLDKMRDKEVRSAQIENGKLLKDLHELQMQNITLKREVEKMKSGRGASHVPTATSSRRQQAMKTPDHHGSESHDATTPSGRGSAAALSARRRSGARPASASSFRASNGVVKGSVSRAMREMMSGERDKIIELMTELEVNNQERENLKAEVEALRLDLAEKDNTENTTKKPRPQTAMPAFRVETGSRDLEQRRMRLRRPLSASVPSDTSGGGL